MVLTNYGMFKTFINDTPVDNTKWNIKYDGDYMNLEAIHNNKNIYMKLNNNEITKLLQIPSNDNLIHDRLEQELNAISKTKKHILQNNCNIDEDLQIHPIFITTKHKQTKPKHSSKSRHSSKPRHSSKKYPSINKQKLNKNTPDYLKTIY